METINLKINGIAVEAPKGSTILEAARLAHIEIPTLCFLKEINEIGACRICIVELKNGKLVTSCVYPAEEGMEVYTNTPKVLDSRKRHYSSCYPTTTVPACPVSAADTASSRSWPMSWAWTTRDIMTARLPRLKLIPLPPT